MTTFILVHGVFGSSAELAPVIPVTAVVPEPGRSIVDVSGAEVRGTILMVSRDDGNGCRSFDLELLASLAPPEERHASLAFLGTQRPQSWAALEQPWPGRSLPDVPTCSVRRTRPSRRRDSARWRRAWA